MALAKLGGSISRALHQMRDAPIVDEEVLNKCLYEIQWALLQADVQFRIVHDMFINVKKNVNLHDLSGGHNKFKIIQQEVANELYKLLYPGMPSFTLKKGRTSVVMFVGLQGSGKTTTCTKYACYHKKKGWKPALVCADTVRTGAFDQLKENASNATIPFYGSLARTKSPVIFIGTGEHMNEFEVFDVKPLVSCLLGMGDWSGYMNEIHHFVPMDRQPKLLQKLSQGNFTSRVMSEQFQSMPNRGSTDQVVSMIHCIKELNPRVIKEHLEEAKSLVSRLLWNQRLMKRFEIKAGLRWMGVLPWLGLNCWDKG